MRLLKPILGSLLLLATPPVCSASCGLRPWKCGGPRPLADGRFLVFRLFSVFWGLFLVSFGMMRRRLHPDGRIISSPPYPHSGGAPSAIKRHVKFCVRRIFWDLVHLCVCLCGYRFGSSDLRFSSLR
jgi:hypothetical protein